MPSAYLLAKDHVEQARAIIANEVWYDREVDSLLARTISQLVKLDHKVHEHVPPVETHTGMPKVPQGPNAILPWLDP